ncbi:DUF108 domain-containing protein [Erysipelothrix sp. HDW6C]|uniref:aspartate dehydrogenase domain-containing protein n=1 Tax=Erysipelothrix sp. HDW6C TaxID=2714930 RepID=UPI0014085483|nr:aspartate dehydrogenase domain-containing protein [Erysipelothrix sp. HDW6C]QIK69494.1 DUF108 domain-containing protein [Erysipelothrix sp. HDW6C]
MKKLRLALIGTGFLNSIVAQAYLDGYLPEYELVGVLGRHYEKTQAFATKYGCTPCARIEDLMALEPNYTAEAASGQSVVDYAETVLRSGSNFIILSIGAFADARFYQHIQHVARSVERKVYIASGAVGGFDILRTAALMSPITVQMGGKKSPQAVARTSLNRVGLLDITEPTEVFTGSTKEAIAALPTHVNVAVATALASAGPEDTHIRIEAIPGFVGDEHRICLNGEEVTTDLKIYSKTSKVAGWSIVAVLQNIVAPIVF